MFIVICWVDHIIYFNHFVFSYYWTRVDGRTLRGMNSDKWSLSLIKKILLAVTSFILTREVCKIIIMFCTWFCYQEEHGEILTLNTQRNIIPPPPNPYFLPLYIFSQSCTLPKVPESLGLCFFGGKKQGFGISGWSQI